MTNEAQRIAIAEVCGWTECDYGGGRVWGITTRYTRMPNETTIYVDVPDYINDLNAMHDAIRALTAEQLRTYRFHLRNLCGTYEDAIDATASQRAEAFQVARARTASSA